MIPAVRLYRERFKPSADLDRPYVMLGINIVAADTDAEARLLATSGRKSFASLRVGTPIPLPPPDPAWEKDVVPFDPGQIENQQLIAFVGSAATVASGMQAFVERMQPDELIVVSHIYDHSARLRSYELVS
jgi:alkanesulfonate monooxygenase SsuD/methylene tetrahydromethanopterin reductase-like flavin-dependent oxidoreductase (luciferase family)